VVLGRLFKRLSGVQEEDQAGDTAVRVLAGNRELSLGPGDTAAIVIRQVLSENRDVSENRERKVEDRVVFQYTPALHRFDRGYATPYTVELGEPARQESSVSVEHKGDHLLVAGKDFRIGAGSGVLHFEDSSATKIPLEREPAFSVEAAGYWIHFGVDWRSVQTPSWIPATRFTVEVFRVSPGSGRRKAAEIQLGAGDMVVVDRCTRVGCEEEYTVSKASIYGFYSVQSVKSLTKMNREKRKTAQSEEVTYREPPTTYLTLEVPRRGGMVIKNYAGHSKATGGAVLVLEGVDGRPVELELMKGTARFYPAPSKGLGIKLGESVFLVIRAST